MERALEPSLLAQSRESGWSLGAAFVAMIVLFAIGPFVVYPVFLMKALCFALFACAFNLLIGYVGLASFGHALFFGWASYVTAIRRKPGAGRRSLRSSAAPRLRHCSVSWPAASPFAGKASTSP